MSFVERRFIQWNEMSKMAKILTTHGMQLFVEWKALKILPYFLAVFVLT